MFAEARLLMFVDARLVRSASSSSSSKPKRTLRMGRNSMPGLFSFLLSSSHLSACLKRLMRNSLFCMKFLRTSVTYSTVQYMWGVGVRVVRVVRVYLKTHHVEDALLGPFLLLVNLDLPAQQYCRSCNALRLEGLCRLCVYRILLDVVAHVPMQEIAAHDVPTTVCHMLRIEQTLAMLFLYMASTASDTSTDTDRTPATSAGRRGFSLRWSAVCRTERTVFRRMLGMCEGI